jgi:formylglycine-generating enzyme required for sulfatase activity
LTRAFYLADREVTVEQFLRFVNDADYPDREKPRGWEGVFKPHAPTPDCPVQKVNWFDAVLYCNWLSAREGRQACYERTGEKQTIKDYEGKPEEYDVWRRDFEADGYRLPTEAEWEYASRATSSSDYCFGTGTTKLLDYAWFRNNADTRTWPGGLKLPNAWGLFDMHGNVREWCWDYEGRYGANAVSDPAGPSAGSRRVLRGGAVDDGASGCRCAHRFEHRPTYRSAGYGFRLCCGR